MSYLSLVGSGYYSYWFSTKDLVHGYCTTCTYVTSTHDVCRDDYGDYSIVCNKCEDRVDIWKDIDDE